MNDLSRASINALAERWAEITWAISWQFCVLGLAVLIIHWSLRRAAPNWRYWLWQILAIKLLLMPFWTAALPWSMSNPESESDLRVPVTGSMAADSTGASQSSTKMSSPLVVNATSDVRQDDLTARELSQPRGPLSGIQPVAPDAENPARAAADTVWPTPNRDPLILVAPKAFRVSQKCDVGTSASTTVFWQAWLMLAWFIGVGWYTLRIVGQGMALGRRLRDAQPAEPQLLQQVHDAAAKLKLSRVPKVLILDADISPFVCGMWRTTLVMPRGVTETFAPEQLDLVLLHELAHILRRDLIWGWIPEIGRVLFFFHPLVYVMSNQIRFERELACDQLAMLSSGRDAATYADTLVKVAGQFSSTQSATFASVESSQV